jgi:branched-chain amino acid transport system ATP-binding protein
MSSANGAAPALELSGLSSGYGGMTVLRDIDMSLRAGEVMAVLGANGAGKSTLLRTVSGLLPALSGSVSLHGADVTRSRPEARARAGLCHVPEGRGIFRGLTVRENLVMQARPGEEAEAEERASEAFPILGQRLRQQAGTLSGGEQQMLALAAAYVRRPSLVMVDEPSLGLAPIVLEQIFGFLGDLARRGTSLLIVDQFAVRALGLATSAYVLRRGSVVYRGDAKKLLDSDLFDKYLGGHSDV